MLNVITVQDFTDFPLIRFLRGFRIYPWITQVKTLPLCPEEASWRRRQAQRPRPEAGVQPHSLALGAMLGGAAEDSLAGAHLLATAHPTELSHLTSLSRNLESQKLRQQVHRAVLLVDWGTLLSVQSLPDACSGAT